MKLLLVKLGAFGDIVHTLPALTDALSAGHAVHWLVDARYRFVCDIFPPQVTVHAVQTKGEGRAAAIWRAVRKLRRECFDRAADLQGLLKSGAIGRAVCSEIYGFDRALSPERGNALLLRPVAFHAEERHVVQQYRRIVAGMLSGDTAPPAAALELLPPRVSTLERFDGAADAVMGKLGLRRKGFVLLHLGGGWQTKQLPEATWRAVAAGIGERGLTPLFGWGSESERQQAARLASECDALTLPERLAMPALCDLLPQARAVVGADTGLLHLAAALAAPTLTFWGPSASWRSGPPTTSPDYSEGERHWHIESNPACGPCFKRSCSEFVCMQQVTAAQFLSALDRV